LLDKLYSEFSENERQEIDREAHEKFEQFDIHDKMDEKRVTLGLVSERLRDMGRISSFPAADEQCASIYTFASLLLVFKLQIGQVSGLAIA
jgi:hypothetical protein